MLTATTATTALVAAAGAGKSHTMAGFAELWTSFTDRRVIRLATATNAARVLASEGLAESYNIAAFLGKIEASRAAILRVHLATRLVDIIRPTECVREGPRHGGKVTQVAVSLGPRDRGSSLGRFPRGSQPVMGPTGWTGKGTAASPDTRDESEAQRADRNLGELLQELRVAGLGVQVLFGFLLSLPFTARFTRLSPGQRDLYLASLVLAALATALLVGPVAYHRLVFRQHLKGSLIRAASVMAVLGLATVALTVCAAVLLVASYVARGLPAVLIAIFMVGLFAGLWFIFPLTRRLGSSAEPPGPPGPAA
jgi:hypothetical protein